MSITREELVTIIEAKKKANAWQFEAARDQPLTKEKVEEIELLHGIEFPTSYKEHLMTEGAGDFAFGSVYSPDQNSDWSLWRDFDYMPHHRGNLIPFSDNGGGDYYCFPVSHGRCEDRVVWADHEQNYNVTSSDYGDFRDFINKMCLNEDE